MKSAATFALLALALGAAPALAETGAERMACTPDVWRLCAAEVPDAGAITMCLRRERSKLSSACRTVMEGAERPVRTVAERK